MIFKTPSPSTVRTTTKATMCQQRTTSNCTSSIAVLDAVPSSSDSNQIVTPIAVWCLQGLNYSELDDQVGCSSPLPSVEVSASKSERSYTGDTTTSHNTSSRTSLGHGYKLNDNDVICGRGKRSLNNMGNMVFRHIVAERADEYRKSKTRIIKKQRIDVIIGIVRSAGGHFLQMDKSSGKWYDIGDEAAAAKVGHALRDTKSVVCALPPSAGKAAMKKKTALKSSKKQTSKREIIKIDGWENLQAALLNPDHGDAFNFDHDEVDLFHLIENDVSALDSLLLVSSGQDDDDDEFAFANAFLTGMDTA